MSSFIGGLEIAFSAGVTPAGEACCSEVMRSCCWTEGWIDCSVSSIIWFKFYSDGLVSKEFAGSGE